MSAPAGHDGEHWAAEVEEVEEVSELEPRGVLRLVTCTQCRANMFTDTAWDHGQLVFLDDLCRECRGGVLFGDTP